MFKAEKKPNDFIKLLRETKNLFFTKMVSNNLIKYQLES